MNLRGARSGAGGPGARATGLLPARWRNFPAVPGGRVDPRDGLRDRGSLTARLQAAGRFSLRLLRQGTAVPPPDEARALGLRAGTRHWVREVQLCVDDRPVVFAHTVLPRRPRGPLRAWLGRLGERSLGALLFARPGFARGAMTFARLDARHAIFAPAATALGPGTDAIRARRSRFSYRGQSVLVTEAFGAGMPALPLPRGRRRRRDSML